MRGHAVVFHVFSVLTFTSGAAACAAEPVYVAKSSQPDCDIGSQLVRQGYSELYDVLIEPGICTITLRSHPRGAAFDVVPSVLTTCDGLFPIADWTQAPGGQFTTVTLCPMVCARKKKEISDALETDECPKAMQQNVAGSGGTPAPAPLAGATPVAGAPSAASSGGAGAAGSSI